MRPERRVAPSLVVDARALLLGGLGRYLREVLGHLLSAPVADRMVLLGQEPALRDFLRGRAAAAPVEVVPHGGKLYSLRSQGSWIRRRLSGRVPGGLAFLPHWDGPVVARARRTVVTVHDLNHFRLADAFPPLRLAAAKAVLGRVLAGAARIIVDSESTRRDLAEFFPGCDAKTRTVPLGVSATFGPPGPGEKLPAGVREPFLLCVGNKKRHKNLTAAVEVLARLLPERPGLRLVVAGRTYPGWDAVLARAAALGSQVREAVVDLPVVPDDSLRVLYGRAEALLFPSYYEGFGLPVLEAMACGAPVVAAGAGSVPEVAGDAALLFEPDDAAGMAEAVRRLMADREFRGPLVDRGLRHAAGFTWERTGRETAEVLREAAES